jgi:hypothetical protein
MKRIILFIGLLLLVGYVWYTSGREHMTPGPPTLASLQKDTKELDEKLKKLDTEFQQMKQQASEGANQAAAARLQISAMKNS